jgi:hypothetical protein
MQTAPIAPPARPTWMPTVAGILDIVVGVLSLIGALFLGVGIIFLSSAAGWAGFTEADFAPMTIGAVVGIIGVVTAYLVAIGVLAVVGGIYALQRKRFGLALAGSIAAIFCSTIVGGVATVFLAMGKKEFS